MRIFIQSILDYVDCKNDIFELIESIYHRHAKNNY